MKSSERTFTKTMLAAFAAACFAGCSGRVAEPTALDLVKEADRHVGEQIKGKVVQIRSEKSVGGLTPGIWFVVYHDPDATFKATEVKFGAGQKLEVTRPLRVIEMVTGADRLLDHAKLKVDSDKAIKVATAEPLLKPVKLTATQLRLENSIEGPVWRVRLWAARLKNPNEMADIGEVILSAETGKVVRPDLRINNVD
jgi:hypothetical protein